MNDMYKRIESLCKAKGVNITQMCRDAGVPRGNLTELKMGRTLALSTKTLKKISEYFGTSIESLIGEEQKKPASKGDELCMSDAELLEAFRNAPEYKKDAIRDLLGLK